MPGQPTKRQPADAGKNYQGYHGQNHPGVQSAPATKAFEAAFALLAVIKADACEPR
jgi:hypothetical protein